VASKNNLSNQAWWLLVTKYARGCGRIIKTAWLIIGATLLLILFLEVACGLIYHLLPGKSGPEYFQKSASYKNFPWIRDYDQELFSSYNTAWRPYVYWRRTPFQGKYINLDARGIRYTVPGVVSGSKVSQKVKIFMFGGSTLWGEGVRDRFTIPSLVAQDLAAHHLNAAITNFGEVAYVNTQELIELVLQLERGHIPDVVIFYDGYNDVYAALQNQAAGFTQFEWKRELEYNISTRYHKLKNVFLLNTLDRFYLGKMIKSLSNKLSYQKPFSQPSKTLKKDIVEVYLNNLKIISALGKAYGFVSLFYWQPVIYTKNNLTPFEKKFATEPLGALYKQAQAEMQAKSPEFAPYHFFDISGLFATANHEVYLDYCHVNEAANQIIAQRIAADLLQIISPPSPGPGVK
jgi:lysophospholipase L1-like esterase